MTEQNEDKLKYSQGAPIYSENMNQEKNIFAILNQDYRMQKIQREALVFMINGVNEARTIIKKGEQK